MGVANSDAKLYDEELQAIAAAYPDQVNPHGISAAGVWSSVIKLHITSQKTLTIGSGAAAALPAGGSGSLGAFGEAPPRAERPAPHQGPFLSVVLLLFGSFTRRATSALLC
jgi:hypothetical protein